MAYDLFGLNNSDTLFKYFDYQANVAKESGPYGVIHEDTLAIMDYEKTEDQCVPIRPYTMLEEHKDQVLAFISKYGIDNVNFYVT